MTNSLRLPLLAAAIGVSVLGGCTGEPDRAQPGATSAPESSPTTVAAPSPTETPVFAADDDVLRVAVTDPATLDPMRIQDPASVLIARQLYEGLTRWDPVEEQVVPAAAASWRAERGGRRFVFKLNPGMTFHDGRPVRAKDFAFAFNRIALKRNASDLAYLLEPVEGFVAVNQLGRGIRLSGIKAPDDLTLIVDLAEPFYDFPAVLTHPALVPVPRRAVSQLDRFLSLPIGNGPFRIAAPWAPGQPVLLQAFAGFLRTPLLDGIEFVPHRDAAAAWIPFLQEKLHVAEVPSGQFEAARETFGEEGFAPLLAGYYYGANVRAEPLDNVRLRKAISRAVDRSKIYDDIYKQTMQAPRGIVPDGMPGFEANICITLCDHSPRAARRLLEQVPRKQRSVVVEYTKGQPHQRVARALATDLRAVGLKVRTKAFGFGEYLRRLRDGKQGLYRLGWIAEYPSPDVFLTALFASDAPDNHAGFSSQKVDRLLDRARATASEPKRQLLYKQAEEEILKRAPILPLGSFVSHWAWQPTVEDLRIDIMGGFDAARVSLGER